MTDRYDLAVVRGQVIVRPAEVSDLVEALQAEGVGTEVGTEVMTSDGYERRVIPVHWTGPRRFLVVPLGEDTE